LLPAFFAGLVEIDAELNILPNIAHSWQVLNGGKLYRFHLRNDVFWTDGTPVNAQDFVWAWRRNLSLGYSSDTAPYLYDVIGARDFHQGRSPDPDSIGVRALDELTLEIFLDQPVAYFPYILAMPVTYPLPRAVIEKYGDAWWQAGNMVSNGAFRLVKFNINSGGVMERNPRFHGEYPGNIHKVDWTVIPEPTERLRMYQQNQADVVFMHGQDASNELPMGEEYDENLILLRFLLFGVNTQPFDDLRVRKALSLALDRQELCRQCAFPLTSGGLIPPGIPGHTPDIGGCFDPATARRLLAEAGFPGGHGFPKSTGFVPRQH
jgi:oligopeptide transport system substrate-binding protein